MDSNLNAGLPPSGIAHKILVSTAIFSPVFGVLLCKIWYNTRYQSNVRGVTVHQKQKIIITVWCLLGVLKSCFGTFSEHPNKNKY